MGPPTDPENWFSASGTSAGLMAVNVPGVTHVGTDGAQNPSVEKVSAWVPPGRAR